MAVFKVTYSDGRWRKVEGRSEKEAMFFADIFMFVVPRKAERIDSENKIAAHSDMFLTD